MKDERGALLVVSMSVLVIKPVRPRCLSSTILDARTPMVPTASASPAVCANRVADISGLLERGGVQKRRLIWT